MCTGFRRHGVTLIEAVLFISIAMALIVGGLRFYQQARTAMQTQQIVQLTASLTAETRALFRQAGFPDTAGRTGIDRILHAAGAVAATARSDDPAAPIAAPWGGTITVSGGTGTVDAAGGPVSLHIAFADMPPEICARVLHFDASGNGPLGIGLIEAGIRDADGALLAHHPIGGGALGIAEGGRICRQAGDGTQVIVAYAWDGG